MPMRSFQNCSDMILILKLKIALFNFFLLTNYYLLHFVRGDEKQFIISDYDIKKVTTFLLVCKKNYLN